MKRLLAKIYTYFQTKTWKREWQEELSISLQKSQKNLSLNMVVIVARESDLYSEILYFTSFLGVIVGTAMAFTLRALGVDELPDLMAFPLAGFALGSILHVYRKHFLRSLFYKLARGKVLLRSKAYFSEHSLHLQGNIALLFLSEVERVAVFLASSEVIEKVDESAIAKVLAELEANYARKNPMKSLRPCLEKMGKILEEHFPSQGAGEERIYAKPLFIGASDHEIKMVPVLRGNKDIN